MTEPTELSSAECLELLEAGVIGRVAMSTPTGPRIVPVNYTVHRGAIVFRTSSYSELATYGLVTDLAFEIDDLDYQSRLGWSVVAIGRVSGSTTRTRSGRSVPSGSRSPGPADNGACTCGCGGAS